MISSKHLTVITIVLTVIACLVAVFAMLGSETAAILTAGTVHYGETHEVTFSKSDYISDASDKSAVRILLDGDTAAAKSANVKIEDGTVTLVGGGSYRLSGTWNGSIIVDSEDDREVHLILDGVTVQGQDGPALYIKQASKTVLSLVEGTENLLSDGSAYADTTSGVAALLSKDDLTMNGKGTLRVVGNVQDAIKVNDTFKMTEGNLLVEAVDDGINVNDAAVFLNGTVDIIAGGDAIKCEHTDAEYGFIVLNQTVLSAEAQGDGIVASSAFYGKEATITLTVAEDAIHSNGDAAFAGGTYTIAAGDDAIHAEGKLTLAPDTISITRSYEGIEATNIVIESGTIHIISSDDGINALGENVGEFGMPMNRRTHFELDEIYLTVNGGNTRVEAGGDGVDSNGAILMSDGRLEIYGPENSGNASLDYEYAFIINGGTLLAAGSSGMATAPSGSSLQRSLVFYLEENYEAGNTLAVKNANGEVLLSGIAEKRFDWVCVSTPELQSGESYTLWINDQEISTAEVTETVTTSGTRGGRRW